MILVNTLLLFYPFIKESISKALTLRGGHETEETARNLQMMDKFFDHVSVHNFNLEFMQLKHSNSYTGVQKIRKCGYVSNELGFAF